MKHDPKTYGILLAVFLLSLTAAWWVTDKNELFEVIIASPGVLALFAALFQLMRDQAAHEKHLELQNNQFKFTIGAASHMANTAFDKHVEFCEEYMAEIHACITTLFKEGDTPKALEHASTLFQLRLNYAVWLTDDINEKLEKYEGGIRKLGAGAQFLRSTSGSKNYDKRRDAFIEKNHDLLADILGFDNTRELNEDFANEAVKKKVRNILGVEELTRLREHLITEATKAISENT